MSTVLYAVVCMQFTDHTNGIDKRFKISLHIDPIVMINLLIYHMALYHNIELSCLFGHRWRAHLRADFSVGSTIFQCRATAQQVEIASWLYLTVLISFKWCNININCWTNTLLIQSTILHTLWNYFHEFAVISRYFETLLGNPCEIAETLPTAGR